jgi:hypothetical protein
VERCKARKNNVSKKGVAMIIPRWPPFTASFSTSYPVLILRLHLDVMTLGGVDYILTSLKQPGLTKVSAICARPWPSLKVGPIYLSRLQQRCGLSLSAALICSRWSDNVVHHILRLPHFLTFLPRLSSFRRPLFGFPPLCSVLAVLFYRCKLETGGVKARWGGYG